MHCCVACCAAGVLILTPRRPGVLPGVLPVFLPDVLPGVLPNVLSGVQPAFLPDVLPDVLPGVLSGVLPGVLPDVVLLCRSSLSDADKSGLCHDMVPAASVMSVIPKARVKEVKPMEKPPSEQEADFW